MPSRRRSRHRSVQILYQLDMRDASPLEAINAYYESLYSEENEEPVHRDEFMETLVRGTRARGEEIDRRIRLHSEHWRLERMPAVDRNILRMAVFEMMDCGTPPAVVIDEALELTRRFSGEEAVSFVNGVLDAVRKELQAEGGAAEPPTGPASSS